MFRHITSPRTVGTPVARWVAVVAIGVLTIASPFALLVACPAVARAEDVAAQAKKFVRGLNSRDLAEREAAEKGLVELGPEVVPHLPAVNDRTPAEVSERLRRVRQTLMLRQVEASAKASVVTLHAVDMPLGEALQSITKQTGNVLVDRREDLGDAPGPTKITLELDHRPFWEALDQVLDAGDLSLYNYGSARSIHVIHRPPGQMPRRQLASYSGPFRITPARFEAEVDLQHRNSRSLKLFLEVAWEPRLRPITLLQPLAAIHATSSQGDVTVESEGGEPEASVTGEHTSVELQIPLVLPPRSVVKIDTLKGHIKALVAGPAEEFRFTELPLAKGAAEPKRIELRKAAVTVSIDRVRKNNDAWEVDMRAKFDEPGDSLESHRGWIFDNEAYFEGPDGAKITPASYEQTREARDEVGIRYLFDATDNIAGMAFVYRTPLAILELPVDYELHDLPLP